MKLFLHITLVLTLSALLCRCDSSEESNEQDGGNQQLWGIWGTVFGNQQGNQGGVWARPDSQQPSQQGNQGGVWARPDIQQPNKDENEDQEEEQFAGGGGMENDQDNEEDGENGGQVKPEYAPTVGPCKLKCYYSPLSQRVCGSDGVTYPSLCHLKQANCYKTTPVKLTQTGICPYVAPGPRENYTTEERAWPSKPDYADLTTAMMTDLVTDLPADDDDDDDDDDASTITSVSSTMTPVPCPDTCPLVKDLVCGTNGITYQSPCELQLAACLINDRTLYIASDGVCPASSRVNPGLVLP